MHDGPPSDERHTVGRFVGVLDRARNAFQAALFQN